MGAFKFKLSPAARVALGLVSLLVTLLLLLDIAVGLMPNQTEMLKQLRQRTCESLATQITSLVRSGDWATLRQTVHEVLGRDEQILSLALRRSDGELVLRSGDHARHWIAPPEGRSTLDHVRVPVYADKAHWGDVEISFKPSAPKGLREWLHQPAVALFIIVLPAAFLVFYLYMRRALQSLDPSAAIPERVRAAFDTLAEGVVVIDRNERIMMANSTFRGLHPQAAQLRIGHCLSEQSWLTAELSGEAHGYPWVRAMKEQRPLRGELLNIPQEQGEPVKTNVNCAPIQDGKGRLRGCLVTFDNVTALHWANEQLTRTLVELEDSRAQITKQNEELQRLATRDPLTGCLNRRAFFAALDPMFVAAHEQGRSLICIMADIDHFKRINDTYGHAVGDQAIVIVARIMSLGLRSEDLLCRYGGEEFCIILADISFEQARNVAERLRREIEQHGGTGIRNLPGIRITSSFGLACLTPHVSEPAQLIELADQALYAAKEAGRNRVVSRGEEWVDDSAAA